MNRGDIVELIENMTFYKKGKKAHFIRESKCNKNDAEVVWIGDEESFNKYGDVEVVPKRLLKLA